MKHKIYPILILFLIFGCDNSFSPEVEEIDPIKGILNTNFQEFDFTNPVLVAQFENQMQWISYLTARAILENTDAQQDFLQAIQDHGFVHNGRITLNLRNLLETLPDLNSSRFNSINSINYEDFNRMFQKLFLEYEEGENIDCQNNRTTGLGGEPRPLKPAGGTNDDIILSRYNQFIMEITSVQCIQFYFPFGFDSTLNTVRSSAHPLAARTLSNFSYEHEENPCNVNTGIISAVDGNNTPNLIITRPYRFGVDFGCSYFDFRFNIQNFMDVNN